MPFSSHEFMLAFLPLTLLGHWLLTRKTPRVASEAWLLFASLTFYAYASMAALALVVPLILLNHQLAKAMLRLDSEDRLRGTLFFVAITLNIGVLAYFKYQNFFLGSASTLLGTDVGATSVVLPLGLSFLTFQNIAFLADVQSNQVKSIRFLDFALLSLFFARVAAGPIVRYGEVAPQLPAAASNPISDFAVGMTLFSMGLFKKVVIADNLTPYVLPAFEASSSAAGPSLITAWIGAIAYTFQLYFDFSGYSDMAIGVARMFHIRLPMNFNSPLKATSIVEFWNRWHITLTRFLTAYLYTPLMLAIARHRSRRGREGIGKARPSPSSILVQVGLPTLITMMISGLWHGAGWQFVAWGALHGVYLTINQAWRFVRPSIWRDEVSYKRIMQPVGLTLTFSAVVIALVFFGAPSISSACSIIKGMLGRNGVWPSEAQFLTDLHIPWTLHFSLTLCEPFLWLGLLFLIVTLAPNSLELLRRFEPALGFPPYGRLAEISRKSDEIQAPRPEPDKSSIAWHLRDAHRRLHLLRREGLSLNRRDAILVSVIGALSLLSVTRASTFIYWHF